MAEPPQNLTVNQAMAMAVKFHGAGELAHAEALYRQILQVAPSHSGALHNIGEIAVRMRRWDVALELLSKAVALNPNNASYQNTLGVSLLASGRADEAFAACQRALQLDPTLSNAHSNLGICYADRGDLPSSIASFEKAIELDADNACAHDGLGLSLLMSGELQRGWHEQEWRWRKYDFAPRRFTNSPHWKGEDIAGKRIFLYVEQGFGDVIQFCRYVPLLAERGATVLLESPEEVDGLLRTLSGSVELVHTGDPLPIFDFACPLMSVPLWYGTTLQTIPSRTPYLRPDETLATKWRPFFQTDPAFKVGIAWAGRPTHANDLNRSTALASFASLADVRGVTFYSFQKGPAAAQLASAPAGMRIIDLSPQLTNFDVTAAMLAHLDLVISVDTALVHLAAAMNRPVWNLLAFCPDWRWMLKRTDTPWYPTMRLFRLPRRGDWAPAMKEVASALTTEATTR
jgi:Glycosyltransferase family 9 (heptosyltransferase)/Tetratricopeptide repeat